MALKENDTVSYPEAKKNPDCCFTETPSARGADSASNWNWKSLSNGWSAFAKAYEEGKETEPKDTQERVKNAIMAHENRIALLKKRIWSGMRGREALESVRCFSTPFGEAWLGERKGRTVCSALGRASGRFAAKGNGAVGGDGALASCLFRRCADSFSVSAPAAGNTVPAEDLARPA